MAKLINTDNLSKGLKGVYDSLNEKFQETSETLNDLVQSEHQRATAAESQIVTDVDNKLAFRDRMHTSLYPTGTNIPANANLNTLDYIKVGCYYCGSNATVATFSNCPTKLAFMMEVLSPLSASYDDESKRTWVYRLRKLTVYNGTKQYVQYIYSDGTIGNFYYDDWKEIAMLDEVDTMISSHNHDASYYTKSQVDSFLDNIADINRIAFKGNVGSTEVYFPLANFVADSSNNYGNINLSGRMGRWENIGAANFEMMLLNRSSSKDGNTITSTVSAQGEVATALASTDIVIYKQDDLSAKAYIKAKGYVLWDMDYKEYQHSVVYDGTYSTTVPTGTLIWSLSTASKTILSPTGALSQSGHPTNSDDLTTKNYVDDVIAGHSHPTPKPGNYFVNGYAGMTNDGVMEVGKYQDWHNSNDDALDYSVRVQCDSSNGNTVFLPQKSGRLAVLEDCGAYLNRNNDLNTEESNRQHKMQFAQTSGNDIMMPDTYWWSLLRLQHGGYDAGYWQDIAVSFDGIMKVRYNQNGNYGPWRQVAYVDQLEGLGGGDSGAVNGHSIWSGTQAEYDALTSKSDSTLYFIVG